MDAPRVHLLHGFNVRDSGDGTVNKLAEPLEALGFDVIRHDFGWRGLFGVRFFNGRRVAKLAAQVRPGDFAIGHSDGCNIIHRCAAAGAQFARVVYINPALNRSTKLPQHVEHALVYADRNDWAVRLSSYLPFHPWGRAGAFGFRDETRYAAIFHGYGHSGIFTTPRRVSVLASQCSAFFRLDLRHVLAAVGGDFPSA